VSTAAEILIDTIHQWGVEVIFGMPGDGIRGIMEALEKRKNKIRFIQVRHEEAAALMACGYAKYTGKIGVCLATSGQGGIHLLSGLYDAKLDGQPVLALTGTQTRDLTDTFGQQDIALDRVFMDVAIYNTRIMGPAHVENVAGLACRAAVSQRGVAHITFPVDIQTRPARPGATQRTASQHSASVFAQRARLPYEGDLRQAAEILNQGKRIAILAGRGALGAGSELEYIAEMLGAPVIKAMLGKAAIPDDSPFTTGGLGPFGTWPSYTAIQSCDTLFMVGTSFPYTDYLPRPGQARAIQIDIDSTRIGLRFPVDVGLVGDSQRTLKQLLPLLEHHTDRSFLEAQQQGKTKWDEMLARHGTSPELPIRPQVVAWELGKQLPEDAILACDAGFITAWWARYIPALRGQMHAISGNLASTGCGLPYAIAAQVAFPERPCIAFVGDSGFSTLMAEFATCVKYAIPVKVVLLKCNSYGLSRWEEETDHRLDNNDDDPPEQGHPQPAFLEENWPEKPFEISDDFQPIDFAGFARNCGGTGFTIENPADCAQILQEALLTPGPVLIEVPVDPKVAPLPPGPLRPGRINPSYCCNIRPAIFSQLYPWAKAEACSLMRFRKARSPINAFSRPHSASGSPTGTVNPVSPSFTRNASPPT
jgi:pyruvate dehydrogenase (quinone)